MNVLWLSLASPVCFTPVKLHFHNNPFAIQIGGILSALLCKKVQDTPTALGPFQLSGLLQFT